MKNHFGDNFISRRTDFVWPSCSCDLTPCDFWLWGQIKNIFFNSEEQMLDIECLKQKIISAFSVIKSDLDLFKRVFYNFTIRLNLCITRHGKHFENIKITSN